MGDIGKGLYVAEDVVPIYREMLDQATIITPNQFEAECVKSVCSKTCTSGTDQIHLLLPQVAL